MATLKKNNAVSKPSRLPSVDFEGREQAALMNWLRVRYQEAYGLTYHVPNGGRRDKVTGAKLKAQGVKAGVPDLVLAQARGGYFGLYIEFKATPPHDASVSKEQREWVRILLAQGYCAVVCKGMNEAIKEITSYMSMPLTAQQVAG